MAGGMSAAEAARRHGAPLSQVRRGLGTKFAPRVSWRPLSEGAANFVRRHAQHTPMTALRILHGRDTTGLVENGAIYVVEPGDFAGKIATKLTGKGSNWPQLIAANPQKKTKTTSIGKEFVTLSAGERLNVPKSWNAAKPDAVVVSKPTQTLPEVVVTGSSPASSQVDQANVTTAAILQAKGLLITWNKTDGSSEAGPTDYGVRPEDMSLTFGPRDKLVALAFEKWSNRTRGTKLNADGEMNAELSEALRSWAEARSSLPIPMPGPSQTPVVVAPAPSTPPVMTAPPVVPLPFPTVPVSLPSAPAGDTVPASVPALPFPVSPPAPAAAGSKSSSGGGGGDALFPLAAVVGGLMLGHPLLGLAAGGGLLMAQQKA